MVCGFISTIILLLLGFDFNNFVVFYSYELVFAMLLLLFFLIEVLSLLIFESNLLIFLDNYDHDYLNLSEFYNIINIIGDKSG